MNSEVNHNFSKVQVQIQLRILKVRLELPVVYFRTLSSSLSLVSVITVKFLSGQVFRKNFDTTFELLFASNHYGFQLIQVKNELLQNKENLPAILPRKSILKRVNR